jgi:hypothetical protein
MALQNNILDDFKVLGNPNDDLHKESATHAFHKNSVPLKLTISTPDWN